MHGNSSRDRPLKYQPPNISSDSLAIGLFVTAVFWTVLLVLCVVSSYFWGS